MTSRRLLLTCIIIFISTTLFAQSFSISGRLIDQSDTSSLIGVGVTISSLTDTTFSTGAVTDADGNFTVSGLASGQYDLSASYIGYKKLERKVNVLSDNVNLGTLKMATQSTTLDKVTITDKQIRVQQLGDTSQFNANAYKTNPDASAEDLITKMPGITSDNNGVKVNGEDVKQVYVDGKPFFGDDPSATLKNLPSEVIDKIQVFDKLSDQSQFTGFDDGNSSKTINIVTKKGKNNGQFGKVYGGYGTDNRFLAGGNINFFNGDRRISIMELSNNVNQQNFTTEDLLGVTSNQGGQNRGGAGRGGFGGGGGGGRSTDGGGGGGGANNFLVGQQGGITTTHSAGINYSDNWGKKIKVSGSYFFNYTENKNTSKLERDYFTSSDTALTYNENGNTTSKNFNHRANLRLEYTIDSFNSITLTPRISYQDNTYSSGLTGNTLLGDIPTTSIINNNKSHNSGYNFSNNLLYQHRFHKKGRTISLNVGTSANAKDGTGEVYSTNISPTDTTILDQHNTTNSNGYTLSGNLTYTEPLTQKSQLMISYNPSYTRSKADKETNNPTADGTYSDMDTLLSNKYDNTYITQRGGLSYRIGDKKLNFMAGVNGQYATLSGDQFFPTTQKVNRNFVNVLPTAMFNYRFSNGQNLRIMYRTNTNPPSVTQLQNVIDNSNPLLLKSGNDSLKQTFENTLIVRYGLTNSKTARNFFVFLYGNYVNNYISNSTTIFKNDGFYNGYRVTSGSQLTKPVNLDNYWQGRAFVTYGLPADFIKSNINLNAGVSYSHSPALIDQVLNFSNNFSVNGGVVISSNISENLDFTVSYNGSYNDVKNTTQSQSNNTYYNQTTSLKVNWIFLKGFVLNTSLVHTYYNGLGAAYDQSYLLWNAYIGYKFLKNRALEARITAYDILNQNRSISRTTTETYLENSSTQVLTQYFMGSLYYTLRNFKAGATMPDNSRDNDRPGMPEDGGGRPHRGGNGNFGGGRPGGGGMD